MFHRLKKEFHFFKQPDRVGDVISFEEHTVYIVAIEEIAFDLIGSRRIIVTYIVQDLRVEVPYEGDVVRASKGIGDTVSLTIEGSRLSKMSPYEVGSLLKNFRPGQVKVFENDTYRLRDYVDIKVRGTDVIVSASIDRILPVPSRMVNERHLETRIEKSGLRRVK